MIATETAPQRFASLAEIEQAHDQLRHEIPHAQPSAGADRAKVATFLERANGALPFLGPDDKLQARRRILEWVARVRISSLEELRATHQRLLEEITEDKLIPVQIERVRDFLLRAATTGTLLDTAPVRREAQGLIDYWIATLYASGVSRLSSFESVLQSFDDEAVTELAKSGDRLFDDLSEEDQELARKMLLKMTRLAPERRRFDTHSVQIESLLAGLPRERGQQLLKRMDDAGIITPTTFPKVTLTHESLTRKWKRLEGWLNQRLAFNDAARFWDQQNRDPAALFDDGPLLNEAFSYRDLGELELDFAEASRKKAEVARQEQLRLEREASRLKQEAQERQQKAQQKAQELAHQLEKEAMARQEKELQLERQTLRHKQQAYQALVIAVGVLSVGILIIGGLGLKWRFLNQTLLIQQQSLQEQKISLLKQQDLLVGQRELLVIQQKRERVVKRVMLLRALGDYGAAASDEEQKMASRHFEVLARRAAKDLGPDLQAYKDTFEVMRADATHGPRSQTVQMRIPQDRSATLRSKVLTLAHQVRNDVLTSGDSESIDELNLLREDYYGDVSLIAEFLNKKRPDYVRDLDPNGTVELMRREFWKLYWGEMGLFEGDLVKQKMVSFGQVLRSWPAADLELAERELQQALTAELKHPLIALSPAPSGSTRAD